MWLEKNCKFKLIVKSVINYLHMSHQNKDSGHTDGQLSIAVDRSTTNAPVNRSGKKTCLKKLERFGSIPVAMENT